MAQNTKSGYVKTQNMVFVVFIAFFLGVFLGIVLTILKTGSGGVQTAGMPAENAAALEDEKKLSGQIAQLENHLSHNPNDAESWTRLGHLYFDTNRYQEAIDAYQKTLSLRPGNPDILTDMGVMYRRNKQPEKALEAFNKAIAVDPTHEIARFNKGIVQVHDLNDFEGAIRTWEDLLDLNPLAQAPNGQSVEELIRMFKARQQSQPTGDGPRK